MDYSIIPREAFEALEALLERNVLYEINQRTNRDIRNQGLANGVRQIHLLTPVELVRFAVMPTTRQREGISEFFRLLAFIRESEYKKEVSGSEHLRKELSKAKFPSFFIAALSEGTLSQVTDAFSLVRLEDKQMSFIAQIIAQARDKRSKQWQEKRQKKANAATAL